MLGQPYPCGCWSRDTVEAMRFAAVKDRVRMLGREFHLLAGVSVGSGARSSFHTLAAKCGRIA